MILVLILITSDLTSFRFSHLEEDPLYIAYADMMAKVDIFMYK